MLTVEYDYEEMKCAAEKILAVEMAMIGLLNTGMSEGAVNGMIGILIGVRDAIEPDKRNQNE